jgi:hypothetical protein
MSKHKVMLVILLVLLACGGALAQPQARKFDEFTVGIGSTEQQWFRSYEEQHKEFTLRIRRFARQLRKERARPYIVAYSPRVVEWEIYNRSIGEMRAGQAKSELSEHGFDHKSINALDGGFREVAVTELWIVPPGAQTPPPTPTVRAEDVAYCPYLRVRSLPYVPKPGSPLEFKAILDSNDKKILPTFSWKVSQGKIINGQDTDTIAVEIPEGASGDVIAKVDVGGYSLACPVATTSATSKTTFGVSHFKFDEYGDICSGSEKALLDNLAVALQNNQDVQLYIIFYGGRCYSSCQYDYPRHRPRRPRKGEAEARAARIKPYLVSTRGLEPERIFVINGGYRESWTAEFWFAAKGAKPPAATPTIQPQDIEYVKGRLTNREFLRGCTGG